MKTKSTVVIPVLPVPKCFTSRQYSLWLEQATLHWTREPQSGVCSDCTRSYAEAMRRSGKCGHPETEFDINGLAFEVEVDGNVTTVRMA